MTALTLRINDGIGLTIADLSENSTFGLPHLQQITGGTLSAGAPEPDVMLQPLTANADPADYFLYLPNLRYRLLAPGVRIGVEVPFPFNDATYSYVWQAATMSGWLALMLKRLPVLLIHGALLEMPDGTGTLLCASGGTGKSTTARRWREAGGICRADDMILLDLSQETIMAHPLPTWSSCRQSLQGQFYPAESSLILRHLLLLDRAGAGQPEEIRPVSSTDMMTAIYFACTLFELQIFPNLPPDLQRNLAELLKSRAAQLNRRFPPRGLFARLDGDLRRTLLAL